MEKLRQTLRIFNIEDEPIDGMLKIISESNFSEEELERLNDIIVFQNQSTVFETTVCGQYMLSGNLLLEKLAESQQALFKKFSIFAMYSLVKGDFSTIASLGDSFIEFLEKVERNASNAIFQGDYETITFKRVGNNKIFKAIPLGIQGLMFEFII